MQAVYALIGVIILGGIVYYFMNTDAPGTQTDTSQIQEESDNVEGGAFELTTTDDASDNEDADADAGTRPNDELLEAEAEVATDDDSVGDDTAAGPPDAEAEVKVFNIDGFNFDFSVDEIRVKEGDTVTINLTSTDGFHDFVVDEFGAATERVQTGQTASVTFVADEAGSYEFYCSVGNHRAMGMVGTLIVE